MLADRAVLHRETGRLLAAAQAGGSAGAYADRRLVGTVQYLSGQLTSPAVPAAVRADLRRLVREEAAGRVPALQAARDRLAAVRLLPWHRSARRARADGVALLEARRVRLAAVARDVRVLYDPRPEVDAAQVRARAALAELTSPAQAARAYP